MPHWKSGQAVEISALEPNLFAITLTVSAASHGEKHLHSYYLVLPELRLLFHGPDRADFYKQHHAFFAAHGGIDRQVMNHAADLSPACNHVEKVYGAPVYIHEADAEDAARQRKAPVAGSFSQPHVIAPGLEALPMPGHSAGFTCFLWAGARGRYLFAGDIVYPIPRGWTAFMPSELCRIGAESLRRLIDVDCDFLLLNHTLGANRAPLPFGPSERRKLLGEVLQQVAKKYRIAPA